MALAKIDDSSFSAYSNLVFNFSWSALSQLALVIVVACSFMLGGDEIVWPDNPRWTHPPLLVVAVLVGVYSLVRLFSVLFTISQVAAVTIRQIERDEPS